MELHRRLRPGRRNRASDPGGPAGHEVFYIASPDNVGGHDFGAILAQYYGDQIELRPTDRVDASGIRSKKAMQLLGWSPKRSWRDSLDEDGRALPKG